jgi:hypothetical protein
MSVTFTFGTFIEDPHLGAVLTHGIDCDHHRPADCCEDAADYAGWCEHAGDEQTACGCQRFDVQVSNANAVTLLERLGLPCDPADLVGDVTPEDLLGRALTGNVGRDDSGTRDADYGGGPGTGRPRMIDCGQAPGYFTDRMTALATLATEAQARGTLICWA